MSSSPERVQGAGEVGLYEVVQANRGGEIYQRNCASCHGFQLDNGSASPLKGPVFLEKWGRPERSLDDLFFVMQQGMPPGVAGTLSSQEYTDILAYVLQQNGYVPGEKALPPDPSVFQSIRIQGTGANGPSPTAPHFIAGRRQTPAGKGPSQDQLDTAADNIQDWLHHTHDYSGSRYSGLGEINTENVAGLRVSCAFQTGEQRDFQTGPLVYQGVMYLTTVHSTFAIEGDSCRLLWGHTWSPKDQEHRFMGKSRGVAIKDGRVVRATSDGYLVVLDSKDGELLWARQVAQPAKGETFSMPPLVYRDLILIGPAGSENNIVGWVGAFRLANGEPVWRFRTIPSPGEPGSETWSNPEGIPMGGGAVWTPLSLDTERGQLFVAVTNPAPDFAAESRPGSNLYTNSLVALNVLTGRLEWFEQLVPNDAHDWDLTQVSPLFRSRVDGQEKDLVATVGKDGMLRVLDRQRRERLYEVAVTTRKNADLPVTTEGVHVCPGLLGGVLWNGPAYHPGTNRLYVPAVDRCGTFTLDEEIRFVEGALYFGGSFVSDPVDQGWLTAVNASSGEVSWRYRSSKPMVAAVTATGGGLVLSGELTGDFIALDANSGEVLYRFNTGGPIGGGIITYQVGGRQFIAVMSGFPSSFWVQNNPGSPTAFVFSLP